MSILIGQLLEFNLLVIVSSHQHFHDYTLYPLAPGVRPGTHTHKIATNAAQHRPGHVAMIKMEHPRKTHTYAEEIRYEH